MFHGTYIFQDEGECATDQVCPNTSGPYIFISQDAARWRVASGHISVMGHAQACKEQSWCDRTGLMKTWRKGCNSET